MSDKKRIAIFSTGIHKSIPSGKVNIGLLNKLTDEYEITVFGIEVDPELNDKIIKKKLWFMPSKPLLIRYILCYFYFGILFRFIEMRSKYDFVISIENSSPHAHFAQFHFCFKEAFNLSKKKIIARKGFRKYYYLLIYFLGKYFDRKLINSPYLKDFSAVSNGLLKELKFHYNPKSNGIVINNFLEAKNGISLDQPNSEFTRSDSKKYFTGIIIAQGDWERKGISLLIEALVSLKKVNFDLLNKIRIIVVGGGPIEFYKSKVQEHGLLSNFIFTGFTSNVNSYLNSSDFFILPTAYEAMSLVVIEAAAAGLPLIVTRVNGMEELLTDGVNGFFISRNSEDIMHKIIAIMDNNLIRENSKNDVERLLLEYSETEYIRKYKEIIHKHINKA